MKKFNKKYLLTFAMLPIAVAFMFSGVLTPVAPSTIGGESIDQQGYVCIEVTRADGTVEPANCGANLVLNQGLNATRDKLAYGLGLGAFSSIGLTTSAAAPAATDTTCPSEIASGGLSRATGTVALQTGEDGAVSIGNHSVWNQFSSSATHTDVQQGCLWNGTGGDAVLIARTTFSAVTLNDGDTLNASWYFQNS